MHASHHCCMPSQQLLQDAGGKEAHTSAVDEGVLQRESRHKSKSRSESESDSKSSSSSSSSNESGKNHDNDYKPWKHDNDYKPWKDDDMKKKKYVQCVCVCVHVELRAHVYTDLSSCVCTDDFSGCPCL